MTARLRLTRRAPVALSDAAHRALTRFAGDSGLERDQALTFLLEHLPRLTDPRQIDRHLRQFRKGLPAPHLAPGPEVPDSPGRLRPAVPKPTPEAEDRRPRAGGQR